MGCGRLGRGGGGVKTGVNSVRSLPLCEQTQGNKKLAVAKDSKNKLYYREAVAFYTKGLAEECADAKLNAVLYSNRAQVQLTLGTHVHVAMPSPWPTQSPH